MFVNLISAALVFRLQMREPPLDWGAVFMSWLHRPVIEIMLPREAPQPGRGYDVSGLRANLNTVYPF